MPRCPVPRRPGPRRRVPRRRVPRCRVPRRPVPRCRVLRHDVRGIERTRANEAKLVFDEQVVVTEDADCPVFSGVSVIFFQHVV